MLAPVRFMATLSLLVWVLLFLNPRPVLPSVNDASSPKSSEPGVVNRWFGDRRWREPLSPAQPLACWTVSKPVEWDTLSNRTSGGTRANSMTRSNCRYS